MKSLRFFALIIIAVCAATVASAQNALYVDTDGEVGIGTNTPTVPLHVITTAAPSNTVMQLENSGPARFRFKNNNNSETWNVGHLSPSGTGLVFSDVGDAVSELLLDVSGNLTIAGTLTAGNPSDTFPDYVFAEDYSLMPLQDLATFVRKNRHLPNVPSAQEIEAKGSLNISEFQYRLLEKVEELTLYALQQQEQIEKLRAQMEDMRTQQQRTEEAAVPDTY
jgi:hypothetical protein